MWFIIHAASTSALVGLIWVVQLVIYPQFAALGPADFVSYHRDYTRRISWIVGPLMLVELGTALVLSWHGERPAWFLFSLGFLALNWISTALIQVPLHRRLERGFNPETHRVLVLSNWVRTLAWTARAILLCSGLSTQGLPPVR